MDKKYYIALELVHFFLGYDKKDYLYKNYLADFLSTQKNDIFEEFFKLKDEPVNKNKLIKFIDFLLSYDYIGKWDDLKPSFFNRLKDYKKANLEYIFKSQQYIPNVTNISIFLVHIFRKNNISIDKFIITHHQQKQFEQNIINDIISLLTKKQIDYKINFEPDDKNEILQLADNFVGVFNNIIKKILYLDIENKNEYESKQAKWLFSTFSLLMKKITLKNTLFLLPLSKKALLYTITIHWKDNLSFEAFNQFYDQQIELESMKLIIKEKT